MVCHIMWRLHHARGARHWILIVHHVKQPVQHTRCTRWCVVLFSCSVPPYMSLLARSVATLEGIALTADPNYQMVAQV